MVEGNENYLHRDGTDMFSFIEDFNSNNEKIICFRNFLYFELQNKALLSNLSLTKIILKMRFERESKPIRKKSRPPSQM